MIVAVHGRQERVVRRVPAGNHPRTVVTLHPVVGAPVHRTVATVAAAVIRAPAGAIRVSYRHVIKGVTLRLFPAEKNANDFASSSLVLLHEQWDPVPLACGWLVRNPEGNFHDVSGPVPKHINDDINGQLVEEWLTRLKDRDRDKNNSLAMSPNMVTTTKNTTEINLFDQMRSALQPQGSLPVVKLRLKEASYFNKDFVTECIKEVAKAAMMARALDEPLTAIQKLAFHVLLDSAYIDVAGININAAEERVQEKPQPDSPGM